LAPLLPLTVFAKKPVRHDEVPFDTPDGNGTSSVA
jgi:hypothetical protein